MTLDTFVRSAAPGALLACCLSVSAETNVVREIKPPSSVDTARLPERVVTAPRQGALSGTESAVAPLSARAADTSPAAKGRAADSAELLRDVPGAAVVRNGAQTGIVQLRGLHNERVKVLVDGMTLTPACPNHMDPPMHYISAWATEAMSALPGVTPVSLGGDSIAGTVVVRSAPPRFATDDRLRLFGNAAGSFSSRDDGFGAGLGGGVATREFSAAYSGSWFEGDDYRFPDGRVAASQYDSKQHDLVLAARTGPGTWAVDIGQVITRNTGTPALPMDMAEDDGWRVGLRHTSELDFGTIEARFYRHETDHLMDNYSIRRVTGMRMRAPAESDDTGFNFGVTLPRDPHTFRLGTEFHLNELEASQQNMMTRMVQDTFRGADRNRVGAYAEWQADWTPEWRTQLGLRSDTVMSDAADIQRSFPPTAADRAAFNARGHDRTDAHFDVTASVRFAPDKTGAYELAFARKTRSPSILERYLWTPLSASAGQADGRTYLGNLDLDPEVAHQVSLTGEWHGERWQAYISPFYSVVSDYIQGSPMTRLDAAGLPVLRFENMDRADLYGAEAGASYQCCEQLAVSGHVSYVRGENHDTDDDLYRIAPLRGTVALEHKLGGWENRAEVVLVARQGDVADFNGELKTPGYVLLNLRSGYRFNESVLLTAGIENVTDKDYADHLHGINRVAGSNVAVGARLPGAGRFFYVALNLTF
jgi:iron complex outermembrane receptor protein